MRFSCGTQACTSWSWSLGPNVLDGNKQTRHTQVRINVACTFWSAGAPTPRWLRAFRFTRSVVDHNADVGYPHRHIPIIVLPYEHTQCSPTVLLLPLNSLMIGLRPALLSSDVMLFLRDCESQTPFLFVRYLKLFNMHMQSCSSVLGQVWPGKQ